MKPGKHNKSVKPKKLDVNFCTECGNDLNNFDFNESGKDKKKVEANWKNCIKTEKFNGDMCSKMFIANEDDSMWENEEEDDDE